MPVIGGAAAGRELDPGARIPPIQPSAAMELYSLSFALQNGYERHGLSSPGRPSRRSRALARRAVDFWPERLRDRQLVVSDTIDLLRGHVNCSKFDQHVRSAEDSGRIALVPISVSTGWVLLFDLPSTWVFGFAVDPQRGSQDLRHHAERLAARVKALSDPTRLAMLSHLAS